MIVNTIDKWEEEKLFIFNKLINFLFFPFKYLFRNFI